MKTKETASNVNNENVQGVKENRQLFRAAFEQPAGGFKHTTIERRLSRAK